MAYAAQGSLRYWWAPACRGPWATMSLYGAGRVTVKGSIVEPVKALNKVLTAYKYYTRYADTGAFNCRRVTGGSSYSLHAYGIALDLNWQTNPYHYRLITDMFRPGDGRMPYRIEAIRTNNGRQVWRWGGLFGGNRDAMHYEITCSPADIRTGINWTTVYGGGGTVVPAPALALPKDDDMFTYEYRNSSGAAALVLVAAGKQVSLSGQTLLTERRKAADHLVVSSDEVSAFRKAFGTIINT